MLATLAEVFGLSYRIEQRAVEPDMREPRGPKDEASREFFRSIGLVTQIGLTVVVAIGLGFAAGFYVDRWLDTDHTFLIVGILFGIGAAFWNVYRLLLKGFIPPGSAGDDDSGDD